MRKIVILFAALAASVYSQDLPRKAPELQFTVPGQGEKLLSQYRGKVVALEFIATTCPHCQAMAGIMDKLQAEYGPRGFQAIDVAPNVVSTAQTPAERDALVQTFVQNFHVNFPVGYTPYDQEAAFMGFSLVDRTVVPIVVLIDRSGMIHWQSPPLGDPQLQDETVLRQHIQELLAMPSAPHRTKTVASARKPS